MARAKYKLFRNLGPDGFKDVTADVGLDKISLKDPRAIVTGDYDGDGATDLLITQNHGPAVLLRNEGGNQESLASPRSQRPDDNKSAIGTKVEVFAGGNRQKFEIAGSSGYLGQNSTVTHCRLGQAKAGRRRSHALAYRSLARRNRSRRRSRDKIYWRSTAAAVPVPRYLFGMARITSWSRTCLAQAWSDTGSARASATFRGPRNTSRLIALDSRKRWQAELPFDGADGRSRSISIRCSLLAVDHPGEFDVYPNEYFASNPPYPPFK